MMILYIYIFKKGSSQASVLHLAASAFPLVTKIEISRAKRSAAGVWESSRVALHVNRGSRL